MFNPPSQIRVALYVMTAFINGTMSVLATAEVALPIWLKASIGGFNAVVALMAVANVSPDKK